MGKRGQGEGSIGKSKEGRWWARISLPNGKRKAFYGKTRQEVARKLAIAQRDRQMGLPIVPEHQTVSQFLAQWLDVVRSTSKDATYSNYEAYVRLHIVSALGKVKLSRLTPQQLQALYAKKLREGLSSTSVAHLHAVIHRALRQALRWGLVATSVAEAVDPPRRRRIEYRALTPEEARRFLDKARGDRFEALYVLALTAGLREGELLALRWKDLDLEGKSLQVVQTVRRSRIQKELVFSEPKTDRSRRRVVLTELAISALRRHRVAQMEERLKAGTLWEDNDLVFPNSVGRPVEAGNMLHRSFGPLLDRAGLPRIRFHDLRHSAATLLMSRGIHPKVVSEMLGHSQITITMDLYSHVLPTMQREAATVMEDILQG